jgi:hypothetical protein
MKWRRLTKRSNGACDLHDDNPVEDIRQNQSLRRHKSLQSHLCVPNLRDTKYVCCLSFELLKGNCVFGVGRKRRCQTQPLDSESTQIKIDITTLKPSQKGRGAYILAFCTSAAVRQDSHSHPRKLQMSCRFPVGVSGLVHSSDRPASCDSREVNFLADMIQLGVVYWSIETAIS